MTRYRIDIVGGGPAGLSAAEVLSGAGHDVTVHEAMPTVGRKLLLAGKSGLNITHSEEFELFRQRFSPMAEPLRRAIDDFGPDAVRLWADELGAQTFVGSSGRVFPKVMKASPLLRAWIARLESGGVAIRTRHHWSGFRNGRAVFDTPDGELVSSADAVLLALGGASWPRLGSDARWVPILAEAGVRIVPLQPANCGFDVAWSETFRQRFAGAPVKAVTAGSALGSVQGEFVISATGIEGSLVYAHAAALRDELLNRGSARLQLDLAPGRSEERLAGDLGRVDAKASFATRLRKGAGLDGVKAALVRELAGESERRDPALLACIIKALPITLTRPRPIEEAISTAGGIGWDAVDERFMLNALPGVFAAGEMIDWEAPTGGYLLTACFATGRAAAAGMMAWLERR